MSGHESYGHRDGHGDGQDSEGGSYWPSSEEITPLLPAKTQRMISQDGFKFIICSLLASLVFLFVSVNLYMHFANCPLYPSTMNTIRRGWEKEAAQHDVVREGWRLEKQEHTIIEEKWKLQMEWHERDVAHQIQEENERRERVRQEWFRENQRRENERQKWRHEVENHDRIEKERRNHEEEERQKLNMFWGGVEAHTCTTYATREYTARLVNLPATWNHRVEACKATPLEVHGISYLPNSCEDKGPGLVIGRWKINQHEPDCTTLWIWYKDKGCTSPGSGKRRIEHYLENLPKGSDWREFCATTPARFHGMEFSGAQECSQFNSGAFGQWEIDDTNCR